MGAVLPFNLDHHHESENCTIQETVEDHSCHIKINAPFTKSLDACDHLAHLKGEFKTCSFCQFEFIKDFLDPSNTYLHFGTKFCELCFRHEKQNGVSKFTEYKGRAPPQVS